MNISSSKPFHSRLSHARRYKAHLILIFTPPLLPPLPKHHLLPTPLDPPSDRLYPPHFHPRLPFPLHQFRYIVPSLLERFYNIYRIPRIRYEGCRGLTIFWVLAGRGRGKDGGGETILARILPGCGLYSWWGGLRDIGGGQRRGRGRRERGGGRRGICQ